MPANPKGDEFVEIVVRNIKPKKIAQKREKPLKSGIKEVRTRESEGKFFLHAYLIPWRNLGITGSPDDVKKKDILEHLNNPRSGDRFTREILIQLRKDYDEILFNTRQKLSFKTKRFKKHMKTMQVKRKTM
ncbi:MAG: hypothetical protein ACTSU5_07695 [Promethearchaeota archaeon]